MQKAFKLHCGAFFEEIGIDNSALVSNSPEFDFSYIGLWGYEQWELHLLRQSGVGWRWSVYSHHLQDVTRYLFGEFSDASVSV